MVGQEFSFFSRDRLTGIIIIRLTTETVARDVLRKCFVLFIFLICLNLETSSTVKVLVQVYTNCSIHVSGDVGSNPDKRFEI